jgi:hypothetical protein
MSLIPTGPRGQAGPPGPPGTYATPTITPAPPSGIIPIQSSEDMVELDRYDTYSFDTITNPAIQRILLNMRQNSPPSYRNADSKGRGFPIQGAILCATYDAGRNLIYLGGNFLSTPDGYCGCLCVYNPVNGLYGRMLHTTGLEGCTVLGTTISDITFNGANDIYLVGNFTQLGGVTTNRIARYTISSYNGTTGDLNGSYTALSGATFSNNALTFVNFQSPYLWVGGTASTGVPFAGRVGLFNVSTNTWTQPGSAVTPVIDTVWVTTGQPNDITGVTAGGATCVLYVGANDAYLGGSFSSTVTANLNCICRIGNRSNANPANWTFNAMGFGVNNRVEALAQMLLPNGNLVIVVGGRFNGVWANSGLTDLMPNTAFIAMWNTVTNTWMSMSNYTFNAPVLSLYVINPGTTGNILLVGGQFTADNTGNGSYSRMARYDAVSARFFPHLGVLATGVNTPSQVALEGVNPDSGIISEIVEAGASLYVTGVFSGGANTQQYAGNAGIMEIYPIGIYPQIPAETEIHANWNIEGVTYDRLIIPECSGGESLTCIYDNSTNEWTIDTTSPGLLVHYSD